MMRFRRSIFCAFRRWTTTFNSLQNTSSPAMLLSKGRASLFLIKIPSTARRHSKNLSIRAPTAGGSGDRSALVSPPHPLGQSQRSIRARDSGRESCSFLECGVQLPPSIESIPQDAHFCSPSSTRLSLSTSTIFPRGGGVGVEGGMTRVGNHTNSSDPQSVGSRVFVGNLNTYVVGKEEVERIFARYGRLSAISMHKGYAFVQYTDAWDARNAVVGEDGRTVAGQLLDVNMVSEPKPHQVSRKRSIFHPATLVNMSRGVPPLKRARMELLGSRSSLPRFTDKEQASIDSLYNNGEPDLLICGTCKEVFPGIHKLIEHKKQGCRLRFTCRCQHTTSPPGAPAMPVCAQCQSRQNTWWELVQHIQTAHNASLYLKDEELSALEPLKNEEESSTCSNCSTSDSRNGTAHDLWDPSANEVEENGRPLAEDKSVDTKDLSISLG